jgi:hypothetical protein
MEFQAEMKYAPKKFGCWSAELSLFGWQLTSLCLRLAYYAVKTRQQFGLRI